MPNNRQMALVFWAIVLLVWCATKNEVRSSLAAVGRSLVNPKILGPILFLAAWASALVYGGHRVGLWHHELAADTAFWFVTAGLVMFVNSPESVKDPHFFRRKAMATLGVTAAVEVFSEVFVLRLPVELLLQPFLGLLGGVSVVAAQRPEHRQVKVFVQGLIAVASVTLLGYVAVSLADNWNVTDKGELFHQFALPVWLTLGVLPLIYAFGLYATYESVFLRMFWKSEAGFWSRTRSRLVVIFSFRFDAREVAAFSGLWPSRLVETRSFREARRVINEFRQHQEDAIRAAAEAEARLVEFAGVEGIDSEGRRLDRREFDATTDALRWLGTCEMGWYRNDDRYRADLVAVLDDDFTRSGLPKPSGIELQVSPEGQAWFAWRRTVTGWVFAIGANGPPPNQWEYDGPEPPTGFPGRDPTWGTTPFGGDDVSRNW